MFILDFDEDLDEVDCYVTYLKCIWFPLDLSTTNLSPST